jgi:Zn-finger nucleic acid-binding protein
MDCPVCKDVNLVMSDRQGIEIDYCPRCRGVWLDRGELDKIIDRSGIAGAAPGGGRTDSPAYSNPPNPPNPPSSPNQPYDPRVQQHARHDNDYYKKKKRSGFLGELFDFD